MKLPKFLHGFEKAIDCVLGVIFFIPGVILFALGELGKRPRKKKKE